MIIMEIILYISSVLGGALGFYLIQKVIIKTKFKSIISEAEKQAINIKKTKALEAKEHFLKLKSSHQKMIKDRERKLQSSEDKNRNREKNLQHKSEEHLLMFGKAL